MTEVEEIKRGHVAWQYWPLLVSKVPANSQTSKHNNKYGCANIITIMDALWIRNCRKYCLQAAGRCICSSGQKADAVYALSRWQHFSA